MARRGELVTVALQGDFGKPRPALVLQSDLFADHANVTLLPITSTIVDAPLLRVTVGPSESNGLRRVSQVMIDKASTVRRNRLGEAFGTLEPLVLLEVERRLAVFLGIAK